MKRIILLILMLLVFLNPVLSQEKTKTTINSSTIEFVVNTDVFVQNIDYQLFINNTIPFIEEHSDEVKNILLIGSASPEGNYQGNIRLANRRADKIYSYISHLVPRGKIIVNNDYSLFLSKTGLDESDYTKLRATYIEVQLEKISISPLQVDTIYQRDTLPPPPPQIDTVYQRDTIYLLEKDKSKIVFGIYNSLSEDLLKRPNIGVEFYFHQMSWFAEGSFSSGKLFNKIYNIDFWHTGLRKYFNNEYNRLYIEIYGRVGWYDTDLFVRDDNGVFGVFFGGGIGIGYKFKVCRHWTIAPSIRFGFDNYKFKDYYISDAVGIDVSFGEYVDGKTQSTNQSTNSRGETVYLNDRTLNKDFYNSAYNMYWFGPTYIGVTIQRNFYIH